MPETEADRILKARENEQRELQKEVQRREEARRKSLVQQVKGEVRVVLHLLKKCGYPDMKALTIGGSSPKAAWKIGTYWRTVAGYGDSGTYEASIYLLSDGRIYTDYITRISDLYSNQLDSCLEGLSVLRNRLEAM